MDTSFFLPVLTLITLLAVAIFAYISVQKTEARRKDPNSPKSTLGPEKDSHGTPADV